MARVTLSICFPPEDAALLQAYKEDGGNISALVARLVRAHFTGGGGDPKMAGVIGAELESRISSMQEEITTLSQDLARYHNATEEAKVAADEKRTVVEDAIRQIFTEMEAGGLEYWREVAGGEAAMMQYAKVRCRNVATRASISEGEAKAAVLRLYPDLEGYL